MGIIRIYLGKFRTTSRRDRSLGMMVSRGDYPQMTLFKFSELCLFTQMYCSTVVSIRLGYSGEIFCSCLCWCLIFQMLDLLCKSLVLSISCWVFESTNNANYPLVN